MVKKVVKAKANIPVGRPIGLSKAIHDRYKRLAGHHMPSQQQSRGLVKGKKTKARLKSGKRKK